MVEIVRINALITELMQKHQAALAVKHINDERTFRKIYFTQKISDSHKFEGLTLLKNSDEKIEFLLCEDKDTEILETEIYKLTLYKK